MNEHGENLAAERERRLAALHSLAEKALQSQPAAVVTRQAARSRTRSAPSLLRNLYFRLAGLALLLILVVVAARLFAFPSLRLGALEHSIATPVVPDADRVYFDPDIPWTTVQVDGRSVQVGKPGSVQIPLVLHAGRHVISWDAAPFPAQFCTLSTPAVSSDTCLAAFEGVAHVPGQAPAEVLRLQQESYLLPLRESNALNATVQLALDAATEGSPVQRGEPVYQVGSAISDGTFTATTKMQLDFQGQGSICQLELLSATPNCDLVANQCLPICSLDYSERQSLGAALPPDQWVVIAAIFMQRNFASSAGEPAYPFGILSSGLVAFNDRALLVGLRWHNNSWQAEPFLGAHLLAPSIADTNHRIYVDPACAAAAAYFAEYLGSQELSEYAQVRFVSGANISAGCLIQATGTAGGQSVEYFERFGVLLALNKEAHQLHPNMPIAGPYVQQLARQMAKAATPAVPMRFTPGGAG